MNIKGTIAALAGSLALNITHEFFRKRHDNVPKINEIAEEGIKKGYEAAGYMPPEGKKLTAMALVGDVMANTGYFTKVSGTTHPETWAKGILYGAIAGIGALSLTKPLGLDDKPVNKNTQVQVLTVFYYVLGGLVTAAVYVVLDRKRNKPIS